MCSLKARGRSENYHTVTQIRFRIVRSPYLDSVEAPISVQSVTAGAGQQPDEQD